MTTTAAMTRTEIRAATACPVCGATEGEHCIGVRGRRRESNHMERVRAAEPRSDQALDFDRHIATSTE